MVAVAALTLVAAGAGWWACSMFNGFSRPAYVGYETVPAVLPAACIADEAENLGDDALRVEAFFSPHGGARQAIVEGIDQAQHEVLVALYFFTDPMLADALLRALGRGVRVEIILDRTQRTARGGQAQRLIDAGIPVHFDTRHRIFHHKFVILDGATVVTGSQNWTQSAETVNAENILLLRQNHRLAEEYTQIFRAFLSDAAAADTPHAIPPGDDL